MKYHTKKILTELTIQEINNLFDLFIKKKWHTRAIALYFGLPCSLINGVITNGEYNGYGRCHTSNITASEVNVKRALKVYNDLNK